MAPTFRGAIRMVKLQGPTGSEGPTGWAAIRMAKPKSLTPPDGSHLPEAHPDGRVERAHRIRRAHHMASHPDSLNPPDGSHLPEAQPGRVERAHRMAG